MVSGHDIQDLGIQWLRSQIGLVSQEPVLFDCSIRENIEYGDNSRQVTMDEVIEAARKANIHTFVDSLPLVTLLFSYLLCICQYFMYFTYVYIYPYFSQSLYLFTVTYLISATVYLIWAFLLRDAMHECGLYRHAVSVHLFVCYIHGSVEMNKHIFKIFSPF